MNIDIAIPTLNREEKLKNCVDSIEGAYVPGLNITILTSQRSEFDYYTKWYENSEYIFVEMTDYSKVSNCWNDFVKDSLADSILFLCDDCTLDPDCLVKASECLERMFPDLDGVVGLNVTNYPSSWPEAVTQYGFRLVGSTFHEKRFPRGQAYCPEYYRFYVDTEMGEYAKFLDRFEFCPTATMQHWHPDAPGSGKKDQTHYDNRGEKQEWDNEIWKARQEAGYLWGKNFNLVGIR